jgi:hypothetical protein
MQTSLVKVGQGSQDLHVNARTSVYGPDGVGMYWQGRRFFKSLYSGCPGHDGRSKKQDRFDRLNANGPGIKNDKVISSFSVRPEPVEGFLSY